MNNETGNLPIDRATATRRLSRRWHEARMTSFPPSISLERYIEANVEHVMKEGLLASYEP